MGNPFAHIELNTDDLGKAKKFYKAVFDWKLQDMPGGMPYTMIDVGGGTGGGMQKKQMPEAPTAWLPYVQVDDVKKTIAKAAKAGARIVLESMDIGEMGVIAIFVDPTGAGLGIWAAKPQAAAAAAPPVAKKAAAPAKKPAPAKKAAAPAKKAAAPAKKAAAPAKKPAPAKKKK